MVKRLSRRLSPSMVVALIALFVALGGVGIAATGGNFILGQANTATTQTSLSASGATTSAALDVTSTSTKAGSTALALNVPAGRAPLKVNRSTRIANLNADLLDGVDSTGLLRKGTAETAAVVSAGGVVDVTNTGSTNGVQGRAGGEASGVYGEHVGIGGFGVAGRAGDDGNAIYGDNTGTGWAGYFEDKVHVGGNLEIDGGLDCIACVSGSEVTGTVSDSDHLDGIDSTGFVKGSGKAAGQATAVSPGVNLFLGPPMLGFLRLSYFCPSSLTNNGFLWVYNDSGSTANVFIESGDPNPSYRQMAPGDNFFVGGAPGGDSYHIQAQGAPGVMTIEAATVHRASDCHAQAQALLTG
jgi:hypothetical protein